MGAQLADDGAVAEQHLLIERFGQGTHDLPNLLNALPVLPTSNLFYHVHSVNTGDLRYQSGI
jgi:hypothetical protein